jgi:hypothetical protein
MVAVLAAFLSALVARPVDAERWAEVAAGSPAVCLEWSTGRALAAGASGDEIAGVLLAIAPWPGSAGLCALRPVWRSRSATTSKLR